MESVALGHQRQARGAPQGAVWAGPGRQRKKAKVQNGRRGWQGGGLAQTFRLWILALILDCPAQM